MQISRFGGARKQAPDDLINIVLCAGYLSLLENQLRFLNLVGTRIPGNTSGKLEEVAFLVQLLESPSEVLGITIRIRSFGRVVDGFAHIRAQEWPMKRDPVRERGNRHILRGGSPAVELSLTLSKEIHHPIDDIEYCHCRFSRDVPSGRREGRRVRAVMVHNWHHGDGSIHEDADDYRG